MKWQHVALIFIAALMVIGTVMACAGRPECSQTIAQVIQVALVITSGTLGNALGSTVTKPPPILPPKNPTDAQQISQRIGP